MTFAIPGLGLFAKNPEPNRMTLHVLQDGSLFPLVHPPKRPDGSYSANVQEASRIVLEAGRAVVEVQQARKAAADDRNLSQAGRMDKVRPVEERAKVQIEDAKAALQRLEVATLARRDQIFAPPAIDPTDAVTALTDYEIRKHVGRLSTPEIQTFTKALEENERYMLAVLRSPVPIPFLSDYARQLWNDRLLETRPEALAITESLDAIELARPILQALSLLV